MTPCGGDTMSSPLLPHVSDGSRPKSNDGSTELSQHRQNNSVPEHSEDRPQNSPEEAEKSPKPSSVCEKLRGSVWGLTYVYQTFWIAAINSLLAPFFPALAASRGNNTWLFGATFSVFHVLMLPGSFLAEILLLETAVYSENDAKKSAKIHRSDVRRYHVIPPPTARVRWITAEIQRWVDRAFTASAEQLTINSLLAPFFPALAASRGNNTWLFGATFSVFHVLMLPGSFLAEILIIKKSLKFAYLIAVTGFTIYASLCGAMYWIDEENSFVGFAIFNAAFGGTAMAIFLVSIITVFTSDSNGGLWMGIKENVSGIGALLGQVGGGFFIDHWKYPTPFFAFTIALVLGIPFIKVPRSESLDEKDESTGRADHVNEECDQGDIGINATHSHLRHSQPKNRYKLLLDPMFLVNIGNIVMASCLAAYNEATLQPYLIQFNLSSTEVGAVFTVKSCGQSFGSLIAGMLTVYKMEQFYIIFGYVLIAIALLIVGPAPFLPFQPSLTLIYVGQLLIGLGWSALTVCSITHTLRYVTNAAGYPNDLKTTSFISSSACRCLLLG
ncbi:uncharacterized protein ISCGN_012080 [Ixodes scapularis]